MPGGYDIVKRSKKRKIQTKEEEKEMAFIRVLNKLGKEEVEKMKVEHINSITIKEQDGMITTLIAAGLSNVQSKVVNKEVVVSPKNYTNHAAVYTLCLCLLRVR